MSQSEHNPQEQKAPEEKRPVVYASPTKRAWAWVGVAYMVIIVLTFTYYLATGGFLYGIGGLMLVPALGGVARTAFLQYREKRVPGLLCLLTVTLCVTFMAVGLLVGLGGLMQNFGG